MPVRFDPLARELGSGPREWAVGRPTASLYEEARNEIDISGQRMAERFPETHARLQPQVLPDARAFTGIDAPEARIGVAIGQILALLLLVLACGNVGILMLARAAARAGELALRTALGANRLRIVSQLFIDSLLLAMFAAGVGLLNLQAVATGPDHLLAGLPFWVDFEVSRRTAVFAISLAVVSAVVAGVIPARAGRPDRSECKRPGMGVHARMCGARRPGIATIIRPGEMVDVETLRDLSAPTTDRTRCRNSPWSGRMRSHTGDKRDQGDVREFPCSREFDLSRSRPNRTRMSASSNTVAPSTLTA